MSEEYTKESIELLEKVAQRFVALAVYHSTGTINEVFNYADWVLVEELKELEIYGEQS